MEIKASKLKEVMDMMKLVVPRKPTIKSVTCVSLGDGKAVATDLETMIIANLPEAKEPMLLPYSAIAEMLKYVPGHEILKIEHSGKAVNLSWKDGNASYPTEDYGDFPILSEMTTRAEWLIDGDVLIKAMVAALPYTATDNARPVLSGVTLVLGTPIEVAAGDGFRMSHQVLGLSFPLEEKVIIPSHGVAILEHVFAKTPRTPPQYSRVDDQVSDGEATTPLVSYRRQQAPNGLWNGGFRDHQPYFRQTAGMAVTDSQRRTCTAEPDFRATTGSSG